MPPFPPQGVRHGNQLNSLVERPDSPKVELMADGVVMITRRYAIDSLNDIVLAPKPKDPDPLGYHAKCVSTNVVHGPQNQSEVVCTFQGYIYLPPTIYEFANSRMDRPIQMHPKFTDGSTFGSEDPTSPSCYKVFEKIDPNLPLGPNNQYFVKFKDAGTNPALLKFRGIEAYIVGSAQFRKTSFALQPDFAQTDVGKLNAPESGPYGATLPDPTNAGKHWLKIEKTCVNMLKGASILWQITEVWQYNDLGWVEEIYGP